MEEKYNKLYKCLKDNRNRKTFEDYGVGFTNVYYPDGYVYVEAGGFFRIMFDFITCESDELSEENQDKFLKEILETTDYQKNEELFREKAQDIMMYSKSEFYRTYNMRYATHLNKK